MMTDDGCLLMASLGLARLSDWDRGEGDLVIGRLCNADAATSVAIRMQLSWSDNSIAQMDGITEGR